MKTIFLKFITIPLFLPGIQSFGQVITREDSLNAGLVRKNSPTVISGYGEVKVQYDLQQGTGKANLTRNVLFLGHRFSNKISFFSEMELEDAKIVGGEPSGEISMEQLFLKFNLNPRHYFTAGLFIPRFGIINENHLPTTFNGNDRPFVERFIIPSTWREIGIGYYGSSTRIGGLNYSVALVNGLNSENFGGGNGIREGRFEGSNATASNLAMFGSLLYYSGNWRMQAATYIGGSAGLNRKQADSLQLSSGILGTPVSLSEANVQFRGKGISFKALASVALIPDAEAINRAYANNTPEKMMGAYAEVSVNLLHFLSDSAKQRLNVFARYEWLDKNLLVPENGVYDDQHRQQYIVGGISYLPVTGITIKLDYVHRFTGEPNPALFVNPFPTPLPYYTSNGFLNLGIGYSF